MRRINAQPTFTDLTVAGLGSPRAQVVKNGLRSLKFQENDRKNNA